jgi:pimeloyl-ACP methyl ester carboxylesterase
MRERRLAGDLELNLCEWGEPGRPGVLLLHGLQDQAAGWDAVARQLAREGLHVIAPDLRGHGRSDHVGHPGEYHLADLVRDADRAFAELDGPAFVIGHSLGAAVAGLLAGVHGTRLRGLALIEPPVVRKRDLREGLAAYLASPAAPVAHAPLADVDEAARRIIATTESLDLETARWLAARVTEPVEGGVRWRWDARLRASAGLSLGEAFADALRLTSIPAPVRLLVGERSDLRATHPGVVPHVLPGGHNLHYDCPAALAAALWQFLQAQLIETAESSAV